MAVRAIRDNDGPASKRSMLESSPLVPSDLWITPKGCMPCCARFTPRPCRPLGLRGGSRWWVTRGRKALWSGGDTTTQPLAAARAAYDSIALEAPDLGGRHAEQVGEHGFCVLPELRRSPDGGSRDR